jgi:transposase-like protein
MTKSLHADTRKVLIKQLQGKLAEHRATLEEESKELVRTHNDRCHGLAQSLRTTGLTCPVCGQHSKEMRFIDKSPDAKSHFICQLCGRSF